MALKRAGCDGDQTGYRSVIWRWRPKVTVSALPERSRTLSAVVELLLELDESISWLESELLFVLLS